MPLDTSIPLQVRSVKFDDPQAIQAKAMQLRALTRENAAAERAEAEQTTLRDLYRSSLKEDGSIDNQRFIQGVAQAGMGDKIPAIRKQIIEADQAAAGLKKTGIETQGAELKVHKDRLDMLSGGLASLLASPNVTHDDVIAQINRFVDQGLITPQQGAEAARNTPGNPQQLRPFLISKALEASDASKRLEAILPKYDEQDTGGAINVGTIDPLTGQRTAGNNVQKTLTPGETQNAENARMLAGAGVQYQTDANGNIIALPSKPGAGPITPRNVTNAGGGNVAGKGLNDSQSKALLFASRGQAANKVLEEMAAKGVNRPSVAKDIAESIPVVGNALGAGVNATMVSPEQQQVDQAQRDFINATLRRESGAAISPSEFDNARKQYFVQIGDSPEVIQQKQQNRELAMRGILAEVPEGMRGQINAPTAGQPPRAGARPPLTAFGSKP